MTQCVLTKTKDNGRELLDRVTELLEQEHEPDPSGCAACKALALIRDKQASVLWGSR